MALRMPQRPAAPPAEQPPEQEMPQEGGEANGDPAGAMQQMVLGIDQALTKVAAVIGKQNPEAGQKLEQIAQMFRDAITEAIEGSKGGGASEQVPMERGASDAQQAAQY